MIKTNSILTVDDMFTLTSPAETNQKAKSRLETTSLLLGSEDNYKV